MLLCYITDRKAFPGGEAQQRVALLQRIAEAARAGVDYIQVREKDLSARRLEELVREIMSVVGDGGAASRLLVNGRTDVALASGADGVHLPSGELPPSEVRTLWMQCSQRLPVIGVSAHTTAEVRAAEAHGADFVLLAPIFAKVQTGAAGIGLDALRMACAGAPAPPNTEAPPAPGRFPVLALSGITMENAAQCMAAGAAGVAAIRMFQEGNLGETVRRLRGL